MQLALVWVGRENRKSPEQALCERYQKRLGSFLKWEEQVVKGMAGLKTKAMIQQKESDRIRQWLQQGDFLVLCDERGTQLRSPQLAKRFEKWELQGIRKLVFCIGGSMGVDQQLRERANFMLSLSAMTLPHALARALLWEQIYRALCIKTGHPYHHEG